MICSLLALLAILTRQLYSQVVFLEVFRKVLGICISKGMVKGNRQAVDSAYIKSNASMDSIAEKSNYVCKNLMQMIRF